jgi:CubicO group peptidase (beta-lactamase class C family)
MLTDLVAKGISFSNIPSYQYEYSNTGYALLGYIVTRVSGMPFQEYIRENIFLPLGMDHTYYELDSVPPNQLAIGYRWEDDQWMLEPMLHNNGSYGAMGGVITTIEDFSKYVSFHLSAWPVRSDPDDGPVKRSTLREMHTPNFSRLIADDRDWEGSACAANLGYGYGLFIHKDCHGIKIVSHGGALPGFGSKYIFLPEYGIGVMAFGNRTYTGPLPYDEIMKLLITKLDLQPRKLPASDILLERQKQVVELIRNWNPDLEAKILAENFYLDKSRERRITEIQEILDKAGNIRDIGEIEPENQLRGSFDLNSEHGFIEVYFTLTPEKDPKVQKLEVSFQPD